MSACCVADTDACGEKFTGFGQCAVPVPADDECEGATLRGMMVQSCCTDDGLCGLAPAGLGCLSAERLNELAAGDGGMPDGGDSDSGVIVLPTGTCTQGN